MNYYPFHLGDYAAHTGHLEPMEDLAYRRLIDLYYLREAPLPSDIQVTAKLVRMRSCAADVESVLNEFFVLTEAGWTHERCDEEIEKMQDKQAKARKSAAASVNARRANAERSLQNQLTDVEHSLPELQADVQLPTPTPTPINSEYSAAEATPISPKPKREEVTLAQYLETCKAAEVKAVPDDHFIRAWCDDAKITNEMLQVAWVVFREHYTTDEKLKRKRYKDWPGTFANAVKDRWHKLWFAGPDGVPAWTPNGLQHKQVLEARQQQGGAA